VAASSVEPVVTANGLTKRYGSQLAVDNVSFELPRGTVTGFVGPNGAGKTTTMRMLLGLVGISEGVAQIGGTPVGRPDALSHVGALIEGPAFYPGLSARRNLAILAAAGGVEAGRIDHVLELVDLADRAGDLVRTFSLGMKQRLGIAAALLSDPEVVLLDEPTNGLDPAGIREMRALIRQLADGGATMLISSHLLSEIEHICDRLLMIRDGRVIFAGTMDEIARHRRSHLIARPESDSDVDRLVTGLVAQGFVAAREDNAVRVDVAAARAGKVNRSAFEAGVTLVELRAHVENFEATFFRMITEEQS
jgi:ABC-2 type transport system ATP-binding protein